MSDRSKARADRIRELIDISQVLSDYGYFIQIGAEHQFSCDLHGDGFDGKPSARVYPESASWYCWACDKTRDAVETVRAKEGIGFMEAMKLLERRYQLPPLPWDDERDSKPVVTNPFEETYNRTRSYEEERKLAWQYLDEQTHDRDLPMALLMGLWEGYDMICYRMRKGWSEDLGSQSMVRLLVMAKEKSREYHLAQ